MLSYDEKVATYWPEFAQAGKQDITVKDVLRHEANLENLEETIPLESTLTEKIKLNEIGSIIEKTEAFKKHGSDRAYHALTRDFITNEIFRRLEPKGRTMGEYFEQEIFHQFGCNVYLRMNDEDLVHCYDYKVIGLLKTLQNGNKTFDQGRYVTFKLTELPKLSKALK